MTGPRESVGVEFRHRVLVRGCVDDYDRRHRERVPLTMGII